MTNLIKILQYPLIKIFITPFSLIGIGSILGLTRSDNPNWISALLLMLIMIISQLIDHYFHQKKIQRNSSQTPEFILYIGEAILIITMIAFILTNHWVINSLLLIYVAFIHLQYMPFNFVNTFYQYLLQIFFYSIVLNSIAYYAQTNTLTSNYLLDLVPFVLLVAGLTIETNALKYIILTRRNISALYHWTAIAFTVASVLTGFYFALPTNSYFVTQIIFGLFMGIIILPILVPVNNEKKRQNKINYLSGIILIFSILYSLALLF